MYESETYNLSFPFLFPHTTLEKRESTYIGGVLTHTKPLQIARELSNDCFKNLNVYLITYFVSSVKHL